MIGVIKNIAYNLDVLSYELFRNGHPALSSFVPCYGGWMFMRVPSTGQVWKMRTRLFGWVMEWDEEDGWMPSDKERNRLSKQCGPYGKSKIGRKW